MIKHVSVQFALLALSVHSLAQNVIDVAENTLKVKGLSEEVFYYGFAEGDQLIFSFDELNGKELKEVEIMELPASSKFMDYKTTSIQNKTLNIPKKGIYKFRFTNSAISGRVCKFKIQRIPQSDATKTFNTDVYWRTAYDTVYTTEQERYIASCDTTFNNFVNTEMTVHSSTNLNGNKSYYAFTIPPNTVAWSYYIGVDKEGEKAFKKATDNFLEATSSIISKVPGCGPMAALAIDATDYFVQIQQGNPVTYCITDETNANLFLARQQFRSFKFAREIVMDKSRMTEPLQGTYFFCFYNSNPLIAENVIVKATAVVVNKQWSTRPVTKMHISSHDEAYLK